MYAKHILFELQVNVGMNPRNGVMNKNGRY